MEKLKQLQAELLKENEERQKWCNEHPNESDREMRLITLHKYNAIVDVIRKIDTYLKK